MDFDLACRSRTAGLGVTTLLLVLCACEDAPSLVGDVRAPGDAQLGDDSKFARHDAALEAADAGSPRDTGSLDAGLKPQDTSDATATRDAEVAPADASAAPRDSSAAASDAAQADAKWSDATQSDAAHSDAAQSDAAHAAPTCDTDLCCMPLTKTEGSASCPKEACLSQRQSLHISAAQGEKGRLRCYGVEDSRLDYNGSDGELHLNLDPQHCTMDGTDLRPGSGGAYIVGHAVDARNGDQLSAMVGIDPGSIKELSVREGRVRVVVEGPVVSSTSVAGLSFDCAHGGTLPVGLCNCFFSGAGPVVTVTFDVELLMP
jgi:hypothetical protein